MARKLKFKKPNMGTIWTEVIMLVIWLFFGDKVIGVLDGLVGTSGNVTASIFVDAYEFLGVGCTQSGAACVSNNSTGLLGIVALVMVVTILMNFISYN